MWGVSTLAVLQNQLAENARERIRLFLAHGRETEEYRALEARAVEMRLQIRGAYPPSDEADEWVLTRTSSIGR
jgi:hypothetical protein